MILRTNGLKSKFQFQSKPAKFQIKKKCGIISTFSYTKLLIDENPTIHLVVMDHTPHLRRSTYLDKELKRVKVGINCYGFACKRVGVADMMPGVLFSP